MLRQGVLGLAGSEGDHGPSIYSQVAAGLKDHVDQPAPEIKLEGNKANKDELKYFENCIDQLTVKAQ